MLIKEDFIPKGKIRPGTNIKPQYITIHSTGNPTSNALGERAWLTNTNNNRIASWHVCVDDKQAVMAIPLNEEAYHAGTTPGNMSSIGVEICESGNRELTLKNAAEVVADLLKKLNLTPDKLKQHFDWSGKNCPRILRDTGRWNEFVGMVKANYNNITTEEAIKFLSDHAGIDYKTWLDNAKSNKILFLDVCFEKIAEAWKGELK